LILALGLGTNATTFALLNKVLWSAPPHVRNPDQLVLLDFQFRRFDGSEFFDSRVSYPLFEYLKTAVAPAVAVAAEARLGSEGIDLGFGRGISSEQIRGVLVSTDYFRLLGVSPVLGRAFGAEEGRSPV